MPRRTTIEVDPDLLAAAQRALGTSGLKDTVDRALTAAVRAERRRRLADRLGSHAGLDTDPATAARARAWRGE